MSTTHEHNDTAQAQMRLNAGDSDEDDDLGEAGQPNGVNAVLSRARSMTCVLTLRWW